MFNMSLMFNGKMITAINTSTMDNVDSKTIDPLKVTIVGSCLLTKNNRFVLKQAKTKVTTIRLISYN
ncbi:unnamed protein product [Rotaria magnacalcarata]